jgi:hypothetical protein
LGALFCRSRSTNLVPLRQISGQGGMKKMVAKKTAGEED